MSDETYVVDLPISPASADVAGAPASMIEHYVRSVGRPQGMTAFSVIPAPVYAAAPDLYAALESALVYVARFEAEHGSNMAFDVYTRGRAALLKAGAKP